MKVQQSHRTMARIKFGSDDEDNSTNETPVAVATDSHNDDSQMPQENEAEVVTNGSVPLALANRLKDDVTAVDSAGSGNESDGTPRRDRASRRVKKVEEPVDVSSELLDEISRPKETAVSNPRTAIANLERRTELRKVEPARTTALSGKALEREQARLAEREKWESERRKKQEEREERQRQRDKEREEAAKKRKEQREASDRKAAQRRYEQTQAAAKRTGTSKADLARFKDQLKANGPSDEEVKSNVHLQNSNMAKLLKWAQVRTRNYENVNIENFHESFADGLALAAIMHSYFPEDIPYSELSKDSRRRNFEVSFQLAKEEGVPELLDIEDMVRMRTPDQSPS